MATDIQADETRRLHRIRRTILEMLRDRGYLVLPTKTDLELPLEEFAHKFDAAGRARESLTMLRQHRNDRSNQIYVFFPKEEKVGVKPIREYCLRLETENVLRAIIVVQTGLTPIAKQAVAELQPRFHLELFQEAELLVNITRHQLVPKHEVLTAEQKKTLLKRYQLKDTQLPRILQSDPVARYFGVTRGQVLKITRNSETAGRYVTYRLVV
ncbi:RNA polymerase I, II, III common subunit [Cyanidioschyzon merolae strain 10D]|jgi:DNA-directed RNA polymerase I, II, and III subunit RPABC1|uniref:RNA polymerase I, II, III common subunit n=1 Tax=Cyanidioschyzon merolae (strain NIES-3377 / 10D) TaxID=280699 RepID=M1VLA1_CYAM1|nr:RNA polymerase I, II, III common subunit [Cyanidioschyzon merolae strain 10D]BAM82463.1 RNA polymerase I, II, III common subunit [Cyanidioschyzon merolae strain 10D]|eukprot:XP_005538499.1 RNA polymerase I, II, III common subunit [Cyanidioschyzon merolae strain 10D]